MCRVGFFVLAKSIVHLILAGTGQQEKFDYCYLFIVLCKLYLYDLPFTILYTVINVPAPIMNSPLVNSSTTTTVVPGEDPCFVCQAKSAGNKNTATTPSVEPIMLNTIVTLGTKIARRSVSPNSPKVIRSQNTRVGSLSLSSRNNVRKKEERVPTGKRL